ncbi:3-alpha domain protein [compost metagenome]
MRLVARDEAGVTVAFANQIKYHDKNNIDGVKRVLAVDALSASWKKSFQKRLAELEA